MLPRPGNNQSQSIDQFSRFPTHSTLLDHLQHRSHESWLMNYDSAQFVNLVFEKKQQLHQQALTQSAGLRILLFASDPIQFLASFTAACTANCSMFLGNPDWSQTERQAVLGLVQPHLIWGEDLQIIDLGCSSHDSRMEKISSQIMIPTGGSSSQIRFAMHTWETLSASVQGFQDYFQLQQINSYCVLPLYHVSGLMQFLRSFITGGKFVICSYKAVLAGEIEDIQPQDFFLSLVPTQLQRLLSSAHSRQWLLQFDTVLLGGAPAWPSILLQAKQLGIRLAPTYGMTETASQIATLKPEEFMSDRQGCGQVLPHAKICICSPDGEPLGCNQLGKIHIQARSLALGYYPHPWPDDGSGTMYQTDDLGYLDELGYLHIVGRDSSKIITGGENVYPAEVEAAIYSTNLVTEVCVIGVPDDCWGQAVTAIYVPCDPTTSVPHLKDALIGKLSRFKQPKFWIVVDQLPRNQQGKVSTVQLHEICNARISTLTGAHQIVSEMDRDHR